LFVCASAGLVRLFRAYPNSEMSNRKNVNTKIDGKTAVAGGTVKLKQRQK